MSRITPRQVLVVIFLLAGAFAVEGARPYAGGWNDGSRLATVESLVERGTLAIDDSIYCHPTRSSISPYNPELDNLNQEGTKDKLFIDGHYYSDKPAVISLLFAGFYRVAMVPGLLYRLPSPAERPDVFCLFLTITTAGFAYLASLFCLYCLGLRLELDGWPLVVWLGSFALGTFALAYTRHVNNHIMHLAILSGVCLLAVQIAQDGAGWWNLLGLGTLAGLGFNLDLGSGPLLVVAVAGLVWWRTGRLSSTLVCCLAALPWVGAGLGINYALGGVIKPINMVADYMRWPGSPFSEDNLTGFLRHSPLKLPVYASALLFGKHGLLNHNLPLLLAIPGIVVLWRVREYRPELVCLMTWCAAGWAMYATLSNNYSGGCCSIRWFVPFLAPFYLLLGVYLKHDARRWIDLVVLSAWGMMLGMIMWYVGPWTLRMIPLMWPITGGALVSWAVMKWIRRSPARLASKTGPETILAASPFAKVA